MKKIISLLTITSIIFSSFVMVGTNVAVAASDLTVTTPAYGAIPATTATEVSLSWTIGMQTSFDTIASGSIAQFKVKTNAGAQIGSAVTACAASTTNIAAKDVYQAYGNGVATFTFSSTTLSGDAATATSCIKLPSLAAGNYYITIYTGAPANDSAAVAIHVGGANVVTVSADVDPTFSFALSANSCDLGVLTTSATSSCGYDITSTSNTAVTNGIIIKVKANTDDLRTASAESIPAIGGNKVDFAVNTAANGFRMYNNVNGTINVNYTGTVNQGTSLPTLAAGTTAFTGSDTSVSFSVQHMAIAGSGTKVGHYTQQVTYMASLSF